MKLFSELQGKKVLITGGGKGIGRDIALAFAGLGAQVTIAGRNQEALTQTLEELQQFQVECYSLQVDMQHVIEVKDLVHDATKAMSGLDILVNNAGINIAKPALEVTEQDWDDVLNTNLKGTFFCAQQAATYMRASGGGRIINIASQMAFVGYRNRAAYCSSKGGVVQMTKALAVEWASQQILVNAVAPTFIETELTSKMFEDRDFYDDVLHRIPLGRLAAPQDVSGAVLFLASDLARMITGETIRVDGGWTAI